MQFPIPKTVRQEYLGFEDRWLILLGTPLFGLFIPAAFFGRSFGDGIYVYLSDALMSTIFVISHWLLIRELFIRLRIRYPNIEQTTTRIIVQIFGVISIVLFVSFVIGPILNILFQWIGLFVDPDKMKSLFQGLSASFTISFGVTGMYESIYFFQKYRASEIEKARLQAANVQAQLNTLKNQVNPHFLFNSLNTLITIIPEDSDLAVEFVQKLSKTYRNILTFRDEKLISIHQELEALEAYIFLLKLRFQDKIKINIQLDEALYDQWIVPLSLQLLIENAIKHNIISQKRPLNIEIYENDLHLVVQNNFQPKQQTFQSTKIGLANIRSRYELLTDKTIHIEQNEVNFTVKLPLIPKGKNV